MRMPLNYDVKVLYTGKSIREQRKIPLRQIEQDVHIAKSTVCKWENGICVPSFMQLAILSKYFDVDWTALIKVESIE